MRFGRRADGREEAADAGAVGEHEHQGRADAQRHRVEVGSDDALVLHELGDDGEDAERGGHEHGDGGGVRHEGREQAGDRAEGDDGAEGRAPDSGEAEDEERDALGHTVFEHRLGEDEGADEGEDGGGAEGREHFVRGGDPEEDDGGDADEAADGDGDGFADPEDHDAEEHGGEALLLTGHVQGQEEEEQGDAGGEEPADEAAALLEFGLGAGAAEFGEAAVGAAAQERLLDVGAGRFGRGACGCGGLPLLGGFGSHASSLRDRLGSLSHRVTFRVQDGNPLRCIGIAYGFRGAPGALSLNIEDIDYVDVDCYPSHQSFRLHEPLERQCRPNPHTCPAG